MNNIVLPTLFEAVKNWMKMGKSNVSVVPIGHLIWSAGIYDKTRRIEIISNENRKSSITSFINKVTAIELSSFWAIASQPI